MLTDEVLKALLEGIIYVAPEPVTLDSIVKVLEGEDRERVKAKLDELLADYEQNAHGIQIRQVANGYKFSTKAEHHEVLRKYVKSLKPLVKLSKPALETLAVIAYRQPVVIHTLLEKKLVVTSGRKSVVGRPILYRTSKDFLLHFGLKDVGELPSLKEFEEMAKRALGSEWTPGEGEQAVVEVTPAPSTGVAPATPIEAPSDTPQESPAPTVEETASLEDGEAALAENDPSASDLTTEVSENVTVDSPAAEPTIANLTESLSPVEDETAASENEVGSDTAEAATEESSAVISEEPPIVEPAPEPHNPATASHPSAPTPSVAEEATEGESVEPAPPAGESTEN
jgi:segregation and condensation protein B